MRYKLGYKFEYKFECWESLMRLSRSVAIVGAALLAGSAHAANGEIDRWGFQASFNLYMPTISGATNFPPSGGGGGAGISMEQILESLNFAFMGSMEARRGDWALLTDVIYMDLGNSKTTSRSLSINGAPLPVGANADTQFDFRGWEWTLAGSHRLIASADVTVDLLAGVRLLNLKTALAWTITGNVGAVAVPDRIGDRDSHLQNWDAIVGVKGRIVLGSSLKWFAPYYFDIGGGESDRTLQAMVGVGYAFKWGDTTIAWRYLDYSIGADTVVRDLNLDGPSISAIFHW
jgi:hypothetical protein